MTVSFFILSLNKIRQTLILLAILLCSTLQAQQKNGTEADLKNELQKSTSDSAKATLYGKLAWELRYVKTNEAIEYVNKEMSYGLKYNDFLKMADAYRTKGTIWVSLKKIIEGLSCYDSCIIYADKANDKYYKAHAYSLMAGMYGDRGDFDKAIELYTIGLEVAKKSGNNYIQSILSNNLADAYQVNKRNTLLVQENFKLSIQFSLADKEGHAACLSAGNLAREYATNNQIDSMNKYMRFAAKIFTLPDIKPYYRASVCNELALIYLMLKQPAKAIPYATTARKVIDSINRLDNLPQPIGLLMRAYFDLGSYPLAEKTAKELLLISTQQGGKLYIRDAYKTLADLAVINNDYKKAFSYYQWYVQWNDSIFSATKEQTIANVELKSLLAEKEFETKFFTAQKVSENATLKIQKWIAIAACVLLLCLILLLYHQYKKKQEANNQLANEKQIVEQQASEKVVLINEIHHRVKNNLTMLKSLLYLQARASTQSETKSILTEVQARVQSMALVHQNLYEGNQTAKLNFSSFIQDLFAELSQSYFDKTKKINFEVQGSCKELDIETAIPLALIMNELATNSFKYAFANNVDGNIKVAINQLENNLTIVYSDNGIGLAKPFDLSNGGFGFKVLNILTQQLNATIKYQKTSSASIFKMSLPV